jgi:hypothetical protein
MGWAGTSVATAAVSAATAVPVADGTKFTAGAHIALGADNKSKAGYKIASVTGNVLTLVDTVSCAAECVVAGYLDETTAGVGTPLESRATTISIAGTDKTLKSLSLDISSPAVYQVDEIVTDGYPIDYVEDTRSISGTLDMLFRQDDVGLFADGVNNVSKAVVVTVGSVAGSIFTLRLPFAELEVPSVTSSKPTVSLSAKVTALGSVGEDSATLAFT